MYLSILLSFLFFTKLHEDFSSSGPLNFHFMSVSHFLFHRVPQAPKDLSDHKVTRVLRYDTSYLYNTLLLAVVVVVLARSCLSSYFWRRCSLLLFCRVPLEQKDEKGRRENLYVLCRFSQLRHYWALYYDAGCNCEWWLTLTHVGYPPLKQLAWKALQFWIIKEIRPDLFSVISFRIGLYTNV